jgi:hypothetical protein
MAKALQKHVVRRQDRPFADWWDELREVAGDRWAEIAEQAPTAFAAWACSASPEQAYFMATAILPSRT